MNSEFDPWNRMNGKSEISSLVRLDFPYFFIPISTIQQPESFKPLNEALGIKKKKLNTPIFNILNKFTAINQVNVNIDAWKTNSLMSLFIDIMC